MPRPTVAVVLPPREQFSPQAAGAVALLVHRTSAFPGAFAPVVIGPRAAAPFADVPFRALPAWLPRAGYALAVAHAARDASLIEVHNRPDVALALARLTRRPVILFLHNDPCGMRRAGTPEERARLLSHLARVVPISRYLRVRLRQGISEAPIPPTILTNCIDLRRIPPSPAERDKVILFAGRVVADKGADTFVDGCARALPHLPGWRAAMLGADRFGPRSPDTPFLRALRPRAEAAGVALPGYRPHEDVLAAMAAAGIAVVPSRWPEPFGMTALEAMAAGAPLLCSPRGGLAEVTGDAAIRIDPDDPAALADAIVSLARDPDRRAALSAAGRMRAALFDLPHAAARLDALRTDVLAAWSAPRRLPIWG